MGHMGSADFVDEVIPAMRWLRNLFAETSKVQNCQLLKRVIDDLAQSALSLVRITQTHPMEWSWRKWLLLDLTPDIQGWVLGRSILRLIGPGPVGMMSMIIDGHTHLIEDVGRFIAIWMLVCDGA